MEIERSNQKEIRGKKGKREKERDYVNKKNYSKRRIEREKDEITKRMRERYG